MRDLALFPFIGLLPSLALSQTCYYPNGSVAPDQFPCTTGGGDTFCCPVPEACTANKLCYFNSTSIFDNQFRNYNYRGSCTDKSWKSSNCPSYCVESKNGRDLAWKCEGEEDVYHCKLDYQEYTAGGKFAESFCRDPDATFVLKGATSIITEMTSPTSNAVEPSPTTSGNIETTSLPTDQSQSTGAPTASESTGASEGSGAPQSPPPSDSSAQQSKSPSFKTGVGIGVGVGVGVVVLALVIAAVFFLRRRKRRASASAAVASPGNSNNSSPDSNYKFDPVLYEAPDTVKYEAADTGRHEAPNTMRYEAPANQVRYELNAA